MSMPYMPGTMVEVRGEWWVIKHAAPFDDCTVLSLEGCDRGNRATQLKVIEPFERARPQLARAPRRASRTVALARALSAIADCRPIDGLWSAASARIELWPHQLEPARAVLSGAMRLLLADAVGLGKTIQAGLILAELRERGWIDRALIVCPAGLRHAWAGELRDRLGIETVVFDQPAIADRMSGLPAGINPWAAERSIITSIDLLKRPETMSALQSVPLDLLIVDEAHHLMPGTDRGAAIGKLAGRTPWCVLVSATPHSGDAAAFDYLCATGSTGDQIAIFKRDRADVGFPNLRRTHLLRVTPTADEAALLVAIESYAQLIERGRGRHDGAARLVAITLARRAASSGAAIRRTLTRRLALLSGAPVHEQPGLPWEDEDAADDVDDVTLSVRGLDDEARERSILEQLIALAGACDLSSKLRRLSSLLRRVREPAIVFTEYRDTLAEAAAALPTHRRAVLIHGGVPLDVRRAGIDAFNNGDADVLLATDTAGEGLNLHARCRLVIDLELPWNPMRLEQRIGRVDRLGQRRIVHAIRMCHRGSIEETVLDRLEQKGQRVVEAFAAAAPLTGQRGGDRQRGADRRDQRVHECVWHPPRRRQTTAMIALYRHTFINAAGLIAGDALTAYRVRFFSRPMRHREWRSAIQQLSRRIDGVEPPPVPGAVPRQARLDALRARVATRASLLYQSSLFDGRADQDASDRQATAAALDAALVWVARATSPPNADAARVEAIALWPEIGT